MSFRNADGFNGRGTLLHLTRQIAVFEVYNPHSLVQLSEVLQTLRVSRGERVIYSGRAVISGLVPTGAMLIVSATLVDPWSDLDGLETEQELRAETERFIGDWRSSHKLEPAFQLAVTTAANFLQEFSRWVNEAEASLGFGPPASGKLDLYESVKDPAISELVELVGLFEECARRVPDEQILVHRAFSQRELHPLILVSPFVHRSFTKPLGYAGDYEMVSMMLSDPGRGPSAYARIINAAHMALSPAIAHRNRIEILTGYLKQEALRAKREGRRLRILNIGCGPAAEVELFMKDSELSDLCDFVLMDFNEPTLEFAKSKLEGVVAAHGRKTTFKWVHRSIHELLRDAVRSSKTVVREYDLVYCAGLYDYLTDRVCNRLTRLFFQMLRPGGLVVVTNVHVANPIRCYMEFVLEWYLEYRDEAGMLGLSTGMEGARDTTVFTDSTGVNVFLVLRDMPEESR